MSKQKTSPRTDDPHDAAGGADELKRIDYADPPEYYDTGARSEARQEIACAESRRADRSLQRRPEHVEREQIEEKMNSVVMQKQRGQEAPIFALQDEVRFERAKPMQNFRISPLAEIQLNKEGGDIEKDQRDYSGRILQSRTSIWRGFARPD